MNKKTMLSLTFGSVLLLLLVMASISLDKNSALAKLQSPGMADGQGTRNQAPAMHVVYDLFFRQVSEISKKVAEEKVSKQSKDDFQVMRKSLKNQLNLSDSNDNALERHAAACELELNTIDKQITDAIDAAWGGTPKGTIFTKENFPKPPPELSALQDARDSIVLKYREKLRLEIGDNDFDEFESALFRNFGSKIKTVSMPSAVGNAGIVKQ